VPRFLKLSEAVDFFPANNKPLKVLFVADDKHPANVVADHITSIKNYSQNIITIVNPRLDQDPEIYKNHNFDAIIIHYSIYVLYTTYLPKKWCRFISFFPGAVIAIHEDEYQSINAFIEKFDELRISALFSCLDSVKNLRLVYDNGQLKDTYFISCLPGYIPSLDLQPPISPIANRPLDVIYRGRVLRPELGKLGYEKFLIGEQMKKVASDHDLKADICSMEDKRIYGQSWPEFLNSGRVMLGVEGGASIFDFNGTIRLLVDKYIQKHPDAEFQEIWDAVLQKHEGNIQFRTITPKFFEAIAQKTGLVLYPGEYNGLLKPYKNFIPLERDLSNAKEVVSLIRDTKFLQEMVDRTYEEIFSRTDLRPAYYVKGIDHTLNFLQNVTKPKDKSLLAKLINTFD
jgi:hypothetical protein